MIEAFMLGIMIMFGVIIFAAAGIIVYELLLK